MAIKTQAQLEQASNSTYTTNGANAITAATVRTFNTDFISSSIVAPMTSSMTVGNAISSSYAATASVLLGSVVSSSYALSASHADQADLALTASFYGGSVVSASFAATASAVNMTTGVINTGFYRVVFTQERSGSQALRASSTLQWDPSQFVFSVSDQLEVTGSSLVTGSLAITGSAYGNVQAVSVSSNTASIDLAASNFFTATLANSATTFFNVTNVKPGLTANLVLTTGTVSSASFSSNVKQPTGSAYLPTSGSGQIDVLSLVAVDASNVYLVASKKFV